MHLGLGHILDGSIDKSSLTQEVLDRLKALHPMIIERPTGLGVTNNNSSVLLLGVGSKLPCYINQHEKHNKILLKR